LCLAAAFGLVTTLGAQTYPQTKSSTDDKDNIKVTGCLSKDASGNFVLNNAHIDTNATTTTGTSGTTTATTGTSSSASSAMSGSTFRLEGSTSDLENHVGHKIEVSGKERMGTSPSSATGTTSTTTGTTGTSSSRANERELDVKSVKMISSSCS
jgi:hypothetical protein